MESNNKTEMLEKMEACGPLTQYLDREVIHHSFMWFRNLIDYGYDIFTGRYSLENKIIDGESWWIMTNEITNKCVSFTWENETEEEKKYEVADWVAMVFMRFIDANEIEIQKLRGLRN